jgi:hypothetical protein
MSHESPAARIERLVAEEQDLLRQRRAQEEFGLDPGDAAARSADTVEHHEQ